MFRDMRSLYDVLRKAFPIRAQAVDNPSAKVRTYCSQPQCVFNSQKPFSGIVICGVVNIIPQIS